jgi:protein TonB
MAAPNGMRQSDFRRMVVISAVLHVGALGLAVAAPERRAAIAPLQVITVDLVTLPSAKPKAAPAPPPPRPKPKPKQIVLPEQPSMPKPKPKPKPKVDRSREIVLEPEVKEEKSLEDLLAEMRQESGEAPPTPQPGPEVAAVAPPSEQAAAVGRPVPKETLIWVRKTKRHVRDAWVVPPGFRTQALETHVVIDLDVEGNVIGEPRIVRRSGNPWYDEGVVRAIAKASTLPPPPEAGEWDFVFVPEDSY